MPQSIWERAALDALEQATLVFDDQLQLRAQNRSAMGLLSLPAKPRPKLTLTTLLPHYLEIPLPDGSQPLPLDAEAVRFDGSRIAVVGRVTRLNAKHERGWMVQLQPRPSPHDLLLGSPQFLTNLLDALPSPIFYKDRRGVYLGCNHAFEETLECTREELVGKSVYDFSPPDLAETYHRMDRSLLDAGLGSNQVYETTIERGDGERREVRFHKASFADPDGELGGLIGILIDITDQKRSDRKAHAAHQRLSDAIEAIHEGFCLFDVNEKLIVANQCIFVLYSGLENRERATGMKASELLSVIALQHRESDTHQVWLKSTLENHRQATGNPVLLPLPGDHWIEIRNYRTQEGGVVSLHSDTTSIKRSIVQAEHQALHDPLTGLPNRMLFEERMNHLRQQADRDQLAMVLLFIDLNNFKEVNDRYGHQMGNECLRRVAERLSKGTRESDTLARFGGDEFAAVFNVDKERSCDEASHLTQRLLATLIRPIPLGDTAVTIHASIGIACYPWDSTNLDILIRNADNAMYRAKQHGQESFQICTHCRKRIETPTADQGRHSPSAGEQP